MPNKITADLLLISTYPPEGSIHGNKFSAVASYAKNTVDSILLSNANLKICVFADIIDNKEVYSENNVQIFRNWNRNDLLLFPKLLTDIFKKAKKTKKILFEFEFGMFGANKVLLGLLPYFILLLRLLGKEVYVVSHGVLISVDEFGEQLGIKPHSLKSVVFSIILKCLYFQLVIYSTKIIVFEEYLRNRLINLTRSIRASSIIVIPHGVEVTRRRLSKTDSRKIINQDINANLILCFGFLIWYKGSDWLIDAFNYSLEKGLLPPNTKLIMAGGFSNTHSADPIYKSYIKMVESKMLKNPNIIFTSFLPEELIDVYFSAADLVVLPHRIMISASGPFSFVLSHEKPFILSSALMGYKLNADFKESQNRFGLRDEDFFFDQNDVSSFSKLTSKSLVQESLNLRINFSADLKKSRTWENIGKKYSLCLNFS